MTKSIVAGQTERTLCATEAPSDARQIIERAVKDILHAIGEIPHREGLLDTPARVARMYQEVFGGLTEDPRDHLRKFFETDQHDEVVVVRDIGFHSMCEHHLLPFFGKAHVAYLPSEGRLTGLSKLARAVHVLSRRPQLQERLTAQIAEAIEDVLQPQGVMVVVEAEHMCMAMRGVKSAGSRTLTSVARGIWRQDAQARAEVAALLRPQGYPRADGR